MKNRRKSFPIVFVVAMVVVLISGGVFSSPTGVFANSASREYVGYDSSGVIVTTENCPIVVNKENLTFDVYSSDGAQGFAHEPNVTGKVTAEYTFFNPSELNAKVRCLFPFGFVSIVNDARPTEKEVYAVKINGTATDKKVRYTFKEDRHENLDLIKDLQYFSDDFFADDFFKTDLPVYEYVFKIINDEGRALKNIGFSIDVSDVGCVVSGDSVKYEKKGNVMELTIWKDDFEEGRVSLSFIGKDVSDIENKFAFFDEQRKSVEAGVVVEQKTENNLKDYVLKFRPPETDASDVDWYNATIAMLKTEASSAVVKSAFSLERVLFGWFDYTLTFAPNETLVNTVVAPLHPTVNGWYIPPVYTYVYLLSPASAWADFRDLTIRINTDMFLMRAETLLSRRNADGSVTVNGKSVDFTKGDGFYEAHFAKLPEGELSFVLCASENPERYKQPLGKLYKIVIALFVGFAVSIVSVAASVPIAYIIKKRKENKRR